MSALGILFVFCLAVEPPSPSSDPNPHFRAAVDAWKEERWDDAAAAFTRAYALDPRPEYVFARAQALRFFGDCPRAIAVYREFIALDPPQGAIDEAREHITTCGGDPPHEPAAPPEPSPDPATRPVTVAPGPVGHAPDVQAPRREAVRPPSPWWRDGAGHALGWTGLAAAGVGAGFIVEGLARRERGERAPDEQSYRDARRGGASLLHAGIPLASVGAALVLGAVIRFALQARRRRAAP